MSQTMERLQKMGESEYSSLIRVLFGLSTPSPLPPDLSQDADLGSVAWVDPTLNDSQKDAVRFALTSREIALVHGPPGVRCTHDGEAGRHRGVAVQRGSVLTAAS